VEGREGSILLIFGYLGDVFHRFSQRVRRVSLRSARSAGTLLGKGARTDVMELRQSSNIFDRSTYG